MFTNEFGQTVKAELVTLSTDVSDLSMLGTTIVRSMVRSSDVGVDISIVDINEPVLHASLTGVTEEYVEQMSGSLGMELRYYEDANEYDADSVELLKRILVLIFGETVAYNIGIDEKIVIEMNFEEYIRRTHGL